MTIPAVFRRNVSEAWGEAGQRWLDELPSLVTTITHAWDLDVGEPYVLSFNWVAPATTADGTPSVLKLGVPESDHLFHEAAALTCFDGRGAVRLLDRDADRGALLLERAAPGTQARVLVPERDEEATAAFITLTRRLHRPPPADCPLPELVTRGEAFAAHLRRYPDDRVLPRLLVERAGRLFDELCASATERVVLHGDLHHDNILSADREPWLAIDPHGVVGDPGSEVGPWLYNPDPALRDDNLLALVPARVEQLADGLALPVERVLAWGFVLCMLSEVWDAEGGGTGGGRALDVALQLLPRLR
ncbi:aminoglycoside phosphotransferase family protein [Micromonospora sp. NPDC049523]|uniref:aminoglycoside phosphotransferase family protein n=1 Tax=Micromonospora sp. NPDC049523 TaxID=3155921 RepID=UPI0034413822